jgi:hypothetical protein
VAHPVGGAIGPHFEGRVTRRVRDGYPAERSHSRAQHGEGQDRRVSGEDGFGHELVIVDARLGQRFSSRAVTPAIVSLP